MINDTVTSHIFAWKVLIGQYKIAFCGCRMAGQNRSGNVRASHRALFAMTLVVRQPAIAVRSGGTQRTD